MVGFYQRNFATPEVFNLHNKSTTPIVTWILVTINILVWLGMELTGDSEDTEVLLNFGAMFGPKVSTGEYWRLFTAMFLHIGLMHLLFNGLGLIIFGQMVERTYGHLQFTIIYILAGLTGSVASYLINSISVGAGASGAIFGIIGALAAFFVAKRKILGEIGRQNLSGILIMAGINLFFGFITPGIDNWAHMGGIMAGFALGLALAPQYQSIVSPSGEISSMMKTNMLVQRLWVLPASIAMLSAGVWLAAATLPSNPWTHIYDAEIHLKNQNYQAAIENVRQAIQMAPIDGRIYYTKGRAFYVHGRILAELGNSDEARSELFKSIAFAGIAGDKETMDNARDLLSSIGIQE